MSQIDHTFRDMSESTGSVPPDAACAALGVTGNATGDGAAASLAPHRLAPHATASGAGSAAAAAPSPHEVQRQLLQGKLNDLRDRLERARLGMNDNEANTTRATAGPSHWQSPSDRALARKAERADRSSPRGTGTDEAAAASVAQSSDAPTAASAGMVDTAAATTSAPPLPPQVGAEEACSTNHLYAIAK